MVRRSEQYIKFQKRCSRVSRPFLVRFGSGLGSGLGLVRVRVRARGWVGSTPVPLSDQEVLFARKREQATAPKIRAANLLGELNGKTRHNKNSK